MFLTKRKLNNQYVPLTTLYYDIESFPSDFLVVFKFPDGEYIQLTKSNWYEMLDYLSGSIDNLLLVGYNNTGYDNLILSYLLANYKTHTYLELARGAYEITEFIIGSTGRFKAFAVREQFGLKNMIPCEFDVETLTRSGSLKEWEARLGMPRVLELPFEPGTDNLSDQDYQTLLAYCQIDVESTEVIAKEFKQNILAKTALIANYYDYDATQYRFKDRTLVENVLANPNPVKIRDNDFYYKPPVNFTFKNKDIERVYEMFCSTIFYAAKQRTILENGREVVQELKNNFSQFVKLSNGLEINFSYGGIHACIPKSKHENVIDLDVASYYPNMLVKYGFYNPEQLIKVKEFAEMIDERIRIKHTNPDLALAMKLILNTLYGALNYISGNKPGKLYDPQSQAHICITGQLLIAKLIDDLEAAGYSVVSANTDGLSFVDNGNREWLDIVKRWSEGFGFILERHDYPKLFIKDVNSYAALVSDGSRKLKGDFDYSKGQSIYSFGRIAYEAAFEYLFNNTPIEQTINNSNDPTAFVFYWKWDKQYKYISVYSKDEAELIDKCLAEIRNPLEGELPYAYVARTGETIQGLLDNVLRSEFGQVARYVLGDHRLNNKLLAISTGSKSAKEKAIQRGEVLTWGSNAREKTNDVVPCQDLTAFNWAAVDRTRYIDIAYSILSNLLPSGDIISPNAKSLVDEVLHHFPVQVTDLIPANGKVTLKNDLFSPECQTIKLRTGAKSKIICLDVDRPSSENNRKLLAYLKPDALISHSSQYTRDDVFAGRCNYKAFYYFDGKYDLPMKKANKNIECFYAEKNSVAVLGLRGDGYQYTLSGQLGNLEFDVNDVLEKKVDEFNLFGNKVRKPTTKKAKVVDSEPDDEVAESDSDELVDVSSFISAITPFIPIPQDLHKKNDTLLTFKCAFPNLHDPRKNNNAFAFKRNGVYVLKCKGEVCDHEYNVLNRQLEASAITQDSLPETTDFQTKEKVKERVLIYQAPTGWGKTEKIASKVILACKHGKRLTIILQSKEAIDRLKKRVDALAGREIFHPLENQRKIFVYTSETNKLIDAEDRCEEANVVISHHFYLAPNGDAFKFYGAGLKILRRGGELIIDEADKYIELATRLSFDCGGLYHRVINRGYVNFVRSDAKRTKEDLMKALETPAIDHPYRKEYRILSQVIKRETNHLYQFKLKTQYSIRAYEVEPEIEGDVPRYGELIDIVQKVRDQYDFIQELVEKDYIYHLYKNPNPQPLTATNDVEQVNEDDILNPADHILVAYKVGDEHKRKDVGSSILTAFSIQMLANVIGSFSKAIFVSATFTSHQLNQVGLVCKYHHEQIKDTITKVKKIVILRSDAYKHNEVVPKMMEVLAQHPHTNSLIFASTLATAREWNKNYEGTQLNDNGQYSTSENIASLVRKGTPPNITITALEASPAKGYNYFEEVDINEKGFRHIYFDNMPVSPEMIKKCVHNEQIDTYNYDYSVASFTQALGRGFRKEKPLLVISINDTDEEILPILVNYIQEATNAEIIIDKLDIFNLSVLMGGGKELPAALAQSELYKMVFGELQELKEMGF